MRRSAVMLWIGGALICGLVLSAFRARTVAAAEQFDRIVSARLRVEQMAADVAQLMAADQTVELVSAEEAGVLETIRLTALDAGIGAQAVRSSQITDQGASSARGGGTGLLRKQTATVELVNLTVPEFGRFLAAWSRSLPTWTITSLDLSDVDERRRGTSRGLFNIRLVASSTYLDSEPRDDG